MGFEITSNFYAYRGNSGEGNHEVLDFSMFGNGTHVAQKVLFIPDTNCKIRLNNQDFTCWIECAWDTEYADMNLTSIKIIEPNIGYYVMYYIA